MQAEAMWKVSTGKGIKIAVVDSGVNPNTASLKGQVLPGLDTSKREGSSPLTEDLNGQGTTTAELIAGTGAGGGIRGLAPGAKIIPYRVPLLKHNELQGIDDPVYRAVKAAADSDAKIINVSVGNESAIGVDPMLGLADAFEYAVGKGKLIITGTGDNAKQGNKPQSPAKSIDVVGVASIDRSGKVADFSQHGKDVDLSAPGVDTPRWCDAKFQRYCQGNGGGVAAAALTSASAALIWSLHPDWTAHQVLRVLYDTASRSWDVRTHNNFHGFGTIRPREVVLQGKGNPGKPDSKRLISRVQPVPSAAPTNPPKATQKPDAPALAASSKDADTGGGTNAPLLIGGIAAVLLLAAGTFAVLRRRRTP
jgi:hypothetical protein